MVEVAQALRAALPDRLLHLTTEDNRNVTYLHERDDGGGVPLHTAEWNDDLHNAAHVLATGETEGYYEAYREDPLAHLGRALAEGFSYPGERAGAARPSSHMPPAAFVDFLQNHDQTGNRALGERLISLTGCRHAGGADRDPGCCRRTCRSSSWARNMARSGRFSSSPHFEDELDDLVRQGRRDEFAGFEGFTGEVPDPIAPETFARSTLDPARKDSEAGLAHTARLRRLLDLRRTHIVPRLAATGGHARAVPSGG